MTERASLFGRFYLYRRGRVAALVLLLAFALVLAASHRDGATRAAERDSAAMPSLAEIAGTPAAALRQLVFDAYQHLFPRVRDVQLVTIVEIDENSLKAIGQWPWPRSFMAELIDAIARYRPAAIGLDIYMPEADQTSPEQVAARIEPVNPALARSLRRLPSHDERLAQSLRQAPTVLGAAGFNFETYSTSAGLRTVPVRLQPPELVAHMLHFPYVLASLPRLQSAARGQALLSVQETAIVRRLPLVAAIGDVATPSLAMEMLRIAAGSSAITVQGDAGGVRSVSVDELVVPTQAAGDVWLHFAPKREGEGTRNVSALQLFVGDVAPEQLEGRLVLIGLTGLGINDQRVTALRELVSGIEVQAQLLESLLDGRMLHRPRWMPTLELALLLACGVLTIWLVPLALARRDAGGARRPRRVGLWTTVLCVLLVGAGVWLFVHVGWLFDGAGISVALAGVLASLVSSSTLEVERDNRQLVAQQHAMREQAARLAGEMEAARRIQLGSLPDARQFAAAERRFAVDALLEPAREVGGDLYDFFMVDPRHLCVLIGDVSGKGVPASLFMAVTKILSRSFATRLSGGPAQVVTEANAELSRGNPESLFVTLLLGVLDLDTGALALVNAGHDAPWRLSANGQLAQLAAAPDAGGPPLGVVEDHVYQVQVFALEPGDRVCLVTDGITEAANADGAMYGAQRLRDALQATPPDSGADGTVRAVRADVQAFVGGAEPSDDLAIVVLQWNGNRERAAGA